MVWVKYAVVGLGGGVREVGVITNITRIHIFFRKLLTHFTYLLTHLDILTITNKFTIINMKISLYRIYFAVQYPKIKMIASTSDKQGFASK